MLSWTSEWLLSIFFVLDNDRPESFTRCFYSPMMAVLSDIMKFLQSVKVWSEPISQWLWSAAAAAAKVASVMSDSVQPHRWQPTKLPSPWDSPGRNTGVGCHFLLQWMKMKSESEVAQSCPTFSDPMDCSLRGSSVQNCKIMYLFIFIYSLLQLLSCSVRDLVPQPGIRPGPSALQGVYSTHWTTREVPIYLF